MRCFIERAKRNIWMLEIALFCFIYGLFVEMTDDSPALWQSGVNENIFTNDSFFFLVAGIVTIIIALRAKSSIAGFIVSLSLVTIAAVVRGLSVALGYAHSSSFLLMVGWMQILVVQAKVMSTAYARRRFRR